MAELALGLDDKHLNEPPGRYTNPHISDYAIRTFLILTENLGSFRNMNVSRHTNKPGKRR